MTEITLRPLEVVPASDLEALALEVFSDEQPSELLTKILASEAQAEMARPEATLQGSFGLAAFRGETLIGWTEGYQVGNSQFHMLNSGVAAAERRNGVYSQLVLAILSHAKSKGYSTVKSLHVAANNPVIIAKLRLGFQLSGFEYSEVYGPLVQLKYFVSEPRRTLYKIRTTSLRPAE